MECKQCGGPMMLETVIKLRRGFVGLRETRSCGAYCAACKISVPMESPQSIARPVPSARIGLRNSIKGLVPAWRQAGVPRPGCGPMGATPLTRSLSPAR
jgi:hypothetical protein